MEEESVKKVVDEHLKKFGGLDVLVNNASKQIMCKDLADIDVSHLIQAVCPLARRSVWAVHLS